MNPELARLQAALGDCYVIERELGGGGMSRVYLAMERALTSARVVTFTSARVVTFTRSAQRASPRRTPSRA